MINKSLNMSGMMRCKVLMDGSIYRAYIPGVTNVEIFDENGEINGTAYETNKSSLPIIQWCAYNTQSCDLENGDGIYWCAFENGNIEKPIVISHTFIGGGTGNGSNSYNSSGSGFDGAGDGEYELTDGEIHDAEYTAYFATPDNWSSAENRQEGGPTAAYNDEILDYTKLTCAAPPEIPFNTRIKVMDTGTDRDNVVYRVNDRGGAIKIINGVYHFDLLMKDKQTADEFGRRKGKVMIGGTLTKKSSTYSNSSGLAKVIEIFKQDCNGKPYGRDPGCYDCSSSTAHCFVKAGLIDSKYDGFTTETFFANFKEMGFKDITDEIGELTYDKLQVGDILWRAHHMAIYCGDGKMTFSNTANKNGIGGFSSDFSKVFRYVK